MPEPNISDSQDWRKAIHKEAVELERKRIREGRKKPINIYKVAEKVRKDYEAEKKYEENKRVIQNYEKARRYASTRSGRFGSALQRGARYIRQPTRSLYERHSNLPPQSMPKPVRRVLRAVNNASNVAVMQRNQAQNYWDWCFSNFGGSPQSNIAGQVENEVHNSGKSHANCGDREAWTIGNEASYIGNFMTHNPSRKVSQETLFHANFQHILPVLNIESEVMAFANILNPQPIAQKKIRKRR